MLAYLTDPFRRGAGPSVLFVLGMFDDDSDNPAPYCNFLHLRPEDGTMERWGGGRRSTSEPFCQGGAREQARQLIGTVTLPKGRYAPVDEFFQDLQERIQKLQNDFPNPSPAKLPTNSDQVTQLVRDVLKPAALDAIRETEGRDHSKGATQTYPVYIIYIKRSRPEGGLHRDTSWG